MKILRQINKNSLLVAITSTLLISAALISCGGSGSSDTSAETDSATPVANTNPTAPVIDDLPANLSPAFDLKGFVFCGNQAGREAQRLLAGIPLLDPVVESLEMLSKRFGVAL